MQLRRKRPAREENQETAFFGKKKKDEQAFFSAPGKKIQRQPDIDNPLQEDQTGYRPGFMMHNSSRYSILNQMNQWMAGGATPPPPRLNVIMDIPTGKLTPTYVPMTSSWEEAQFFRTPDTPKVVCKSSGSQMSYVESVTAGYSNPEFKMLIAEEVLNNKTDATQTSPYRSLWRSLDNQLRIHATEHFGRYKTEVASVYKALMADLNQLPDINSPIQVSVPDLEAYTISLIDYYSELLDYQLWKSKCDWEKTDYPSLVARANKGQVATFPTTMTLKVQCGQAPVVRAKPALGKSMTVTSGTTVKPVKAPAAPATPTKPATPSKTK